MEFRELVRQNKAISREACIQVLKEQNRGVLSIIGDGGYPYGMPMNHWYDEETDILWFHCGNVGHRLESLRICDKVSFCCYDPGYREADQWAWKVRSVIAFGTIEIIEDMDAIIDITTKLSHKFIQDEEYIRKEIAGSAHRTLLLKMKIEHMTGKLVTEA